MKLGEARTDFDGRELKQVPGEARWTQDLFWWTWIEKVLGEARWTQDPFWWTWIETSTGRSWVNLVKGRTYFDGRELKKYQVNLGEPRTDFDGRELKKLLGEARQS